MSSTYVAMEELKKISFIDVYSIGGRTLPSTVFHDGNEWHMWLPVEDGRMIKMQGKPADSDFWGKSIREDDELCLRFLNFLQQQANWPENVKLVHGIREDIHNIGAMFRRMTHLKESKFTMGFSARAYSLDVELLFTILRSMFDDFQKIICAVWRRVELLDRSKKKKELPSSFADMVMKGGHVRDANELMERYAIPEKIAFAYSRCGDYFQAVRRQRDDIVHRGGSPAFVFSTEAGPAIIDTQEPFCRFISWRKECYLSNNPNALASLSYAMKSITVLTLLAMDELSEALAQTIKLPDPIVPGFIYITKGPAVHDLRKIIHSEQIEPW